MNGIASYEVALASGSLLCPICRVPVGDTLAHVVRHAARHLIDQATECVEAQELAAVSALRDPDAAWTALHGSAALYGTIVVWSVGEKTHRLDLPDAGRARSAFVEITRHLP
jgi:hypothetical protein